MFCKIVFLFLIITAISFVGFSGMQEQAFAGADWHVNSGETKTIEFSQERIIHDTQYYYIEAGGTLVIKGHLLIMEGGVVDNKGTINIVEGKDAVIEGKAPGQISNHGIIENQGNINNANLFYNYNKINNGEEGVGEGQSGPQEIF